MDDASGAVLLLLDLPPAALCGIDLLSFTASPRFRGLKHVPPGLHFVFASATSTLSLRHGAWFLAAPRGTAVSRDSAPHVTIRRWDADAEELVEEHDAVQAMRWRANLGSVWREGLTPYRQTAAGGAHDNGGEAVHEREDWMALTDRMTTTLLDRVTGVVAGVGISASAGSWTMHTASTAPQDFDAIPGLSRAEAIAGAGERPLHFLAVDLRRTWRAGAVGRERSDAARDLSFAFENVCASAAGGAVELLGELQLCFVLVLTLNCHSALQQWRRLTELTLRCRAAVGHMPDVFAKLLQVLRLQLQRAGDAADGGLFDIGEDGGTWLRGLLKGFRRGSLDGGGKEEVVVALEELEDWLGEEHGWRVRDDVVRSGMLALEDGEQVEMDMGAGADGDDDDEDGEYAPTIVELTQEQLHALPGEFSASKVKSQRDKSTLQRLDEEVDQSGASGAEDDAHAQPEDEDKRTLEELDERY